MHRITITQTIRTNLKPRQAYLLLHSYSKAQVELEPKFGQIIQRQSLHTTTQRIQGSRELEPKLGQIIHKTKCTHYNTANPMLQETRAKIWSNYTQDIVYILQHSYSKAAVELEPKFGQIIHNTKSTYYNTATPRLQWN